MNGQDKLIVAKAIMLVCLPNLHLTTYMLLIPIQAQEEYPFLARYAEGWPIRDFFSRFLRNHVSQSKKKGNTSDNEDERSEVCEDDGIDYKSDDDTDSDNDDNPRHPQNSTKVCVISCCIYGHCLIREKTE